MYSEAKLAFYIYLWFPKTKVIFLCDQMNFVVPKESFILNRSAKLKGGVITGQNM